MRRCVICGAEFVGKYKTTTCSPECKAMQRKQYQDEYTRTHAEQRRKSAREWAQAHPDRYRDYQRDWRRQRVSEPRHALNDYLSKALNQAIRTGTGGRWVSLLGYGPDELRAHLESTFTEGMSFDNYGEWQVDHVVPKREYGFPLEGEPGFKECWSLANLRARWATDNRADSRERVA